MKCFIRSSNLKWVIVIIVVVTMVIVVVMDSLIRIAQSSTVPLNGLGNHTHGIILPNDPLVQLILQPQQLVFL